jgi:hypothetical protein
MQPAFDFDGTKVDEGVLFYWSTVSISRALRFYAEARNQQTTGYVLATIATYYCTIAPSILACVSEIWAHERQTNDSNLRVFNELRL